MAKDCTSTARFGYCIEAVSRISSVGM
jgi:hypothetical protein